MKNEQNNTIKEKLQADIFAITQSLTIAVAMDCAKENLGSMFDDMTMTQRNIIESHIAALHKKIEMANEDNRYSEGYRIAKKVLEEKLLPLQSKLRETLYNYFRLYHNNKSSDWAAWGEMIRISYESLTKTPVIHEVPWCLAAEDQYLTQVKDDFKKLQKACEEEWQPVCQSLCTPQEQREEGFYVDISKAVTAYRKEFLTCYNEIGDIIEKDFNLQ